MPKATRQIITDDSVGVAENNFVDLKKKKLKSIYFYNKTEDGEKRNQQSIGRIIGISESGAESHIFYWYKVV